ncbi:MAG: winged helix-turn-helix domain-containing protein [Anaerolineae bacterium]|nr:winged helix-turn-helix domain-containing protein [Thermoflexus sp.]MDW8064366.1 winged helix-turn-helix domain-containing protein [Anaerolineae bacterium]
MTKIGNGTVHLRVLIIHPDLKAGEQFLQSAIQAGHLAHYAPDLRGTLSFVARVIPDIIVADREWLERNGRGLFSALQGCSPLPLICPVEGVDRDSVWERLARAMRAFQTWTGGEVVRVGSLVIDHGRKQVIWRGQPVQLPPLQFKIMTVLAQRAGQVVSHTDLVREVWGIDAEDPEARELLKVHIRQIRKRLGLDPERGEVLVSVRGFGYMLTLPED